LSIIVPALISLGLVLISIIWLNTINLQIAREKVKIANLDREIEVNRTIQDEIKSLEAKQTEMQIKVTGLKSINVNRSKWVDALELYADILPENTWLTGIEEADGGIITVSGITAADAEVGQFMNRLFDESSVSDINLVEMKDAGRNGQLKSFSVKHSFIHVSEN
jgi:Tfp pilus assembly protein PilN